MDVQQDLVGKNKEKQFVIYGFNYWNNKLIYVLLKKSFEVLIPYFSLNALLYFPFNRYLNITRKNQKLLLQNNN